MDVNIENKIVQILLLTLLLNWAILLVGLKKLLTERRRQILVYWYQYHKKSNLWPTIREAALDLNLSYSAIKFHLDKLEKVDWIVKQNHQIALTKQGEKSIYEAELVTLGKMTKKINRVKNILIGRNKPKDDGHSKSS